MKPQTHLQSRKLTLEDAQGDAWKASLEYTINVDEHITMQLLLPKKDLVEHGSQATIKRIELALLQRLKEVVDDIAIVQYGKPA